VNILHFSFVSFTRGTMANISPSTKNLMGKNSKYKYQKSRHHKMVRGKGPDRPMAIPELLDMVKQIIPQFDKYVIDELVETHTRKISGLPPYHCELNPIELAWASVKGHVKSNNTSYNLCDVKSLLMEGIERVNENNMWKNFIRHTTEKEEKFNKIDFIVDNMLTAETERITMTLGDTSSDSELSD